MLPSELHATALIIRSPPCRQNQKDGVIYKQVHILKHHSRYFARPASVSLSLQSHFLNITDEEKIMSKFNREMGLLGFALSACVLVVGALFNFTFQPIDAVRQIFLCRPDFRQLALGAPQKSAERFFLSAGLHWLITVAVSPWSFDLVLNCGVDLLPVSCLTNFVHPSDPNSNFFRPNFFKENKGSASRSH